MTTRIASVCVALALLAPAFAAAEEDLRAAIELAVRSDPNSASLSDAEIQELVSALYADASEQGMTAEDVTWRPTAPETLQSGGECGFTCKVMTAFGFNGPDYIIPIMLGASSLMLIFLIGAVAEYRHFRHLHPKHAAAAAAASVAPMQPPQPPQTPEVAQ